MQTPRYRLEPSRYCLATSLSLSLPLSRSLSLSLFLSLSAQNVSIKLARYFNDCVWGLAFRVWDAVPGVRCVWLGPFARDASIIIVFS